MPGLIFEGDTTQRFGEKFPKPFIQEIRVFDDVIEADIVLFFKVSLEENIDNFKDNLSKYDFYSGFGGMTSRDSLAEFVSVDEEIFNSDGERFIKLMLEKRIDFGSEISTTNQETSAYISEARAAEGVSVFDTITSSPSLSERTETDAFATAQVPAQTLTLQKYFYCCTTLKEDESSNLNITQDLTIIDPTGGYNRIANSSSPLVYERVFKGDGTLNTDPADSYQEADGNIYGQTPLMSLDGRYRKTDNITNKTIIDGVGAAIGPYVGTGMAEADNLAVTLQTHKDDPRLLKEISKQTKKFSNKSSVTPTGTLYDSMVDVITSFDNTLLSEDVLERRRFSNAKIKDRRGDISLVKDNDFSEGLGLFQTYIYKPLISRGVISVSGKTVQGTAEELSENFIVSNQSYYFFDYEKALNYETEISNFFNPYSLLQIFGNNCLNNYFKVETVQIEKTKNPQASAPSSTTALVLSYPREVGGFLGASSYIPSSYTFETTDPTNNLSRRQIKRTEKVQRSSNYGTWTEEVETTETIHSQIVERAFDTLESIDGYRLKCYEIVDLEKIDIANQPATYESEIVVKDTTMQFYEEHLRHPILKMYEQLTRYLDFADDFCSFNNIDGRFNDFFVDAIQNEFESPFPWHQGPLLYCSVLAALQASWEVLDGKDVEFEARKRNGSSIDLNLVKQNAILKSRQISPSTGDLDSLQAFVSDFRKFKDYFEVGAGLDKNNEIYETLAVGALLLKRREELKTFEKTTQLPDQINSHFDIVPVFASKERFSLNSVDGDTMTYEEARVNIILPQQDNILDDMRTKAFDFIFQKGLTWRMMFVLYGADVGDLNAQTKRVLQYLVPLVEAFNDLGFELSIGEFLGVTEEEVRTGAFREEEVFTRGAITVPLSSL